MKTEELKKLVTNLNYKEKYFIHMQNLKQWLNHGLLSKVHRIIIFNIKATPKPYIDMETDLRDKAKNYFEKKKKKKTFWVNE